MEVKGLNWEDMAKKLGISVEVEMSRLLADIRGSTPLAEGMAPAEFTRMIDRIYGVGINTGKAVCGTVGSDEGMIEITALGDAPNLAARLASQAAAGEVILSASTVQKAGVDTSNLERRTVELKGKSEPLNVWVMRVRQKER